METIVAHGTGTYGILGDKLVVDIAVLARPSMARASSNFSPKWPADFARYVADLHEIPAENYPAFEQEFIDAFSLNSIRSSPRYTQSVGG